MKPRGTGVLKKFLFPGDLPMKFFTRILPAVTAILLLLVASRLRPQNDKGNITGHVTDSSGAVLQGAEVELQPTDATVASNAQGAYLVRNLISGTYTITVTYVGFALFTKV